MILQSPILSQLAWIDHGFGTRLAPLSQEGMASLKQIHSAVALVANQPGCAGDGDALLTNRPGLRLSVRTADCYPILLADSKNRAVAAVHAGWRGAADEIVAKTIAKMRTQFGTSPPDIVAAIGPGIGVCCYQVGAEVAQLFGVEGAGRVDLAAANRCQLIDAGVEDRHIDVLGGCTSCDAARFYSFRREKEQAGRMISYIGLV
ncbi:MAG TPA: peptidoglycan editing factor PgeF [Bryobacteraceae bacterium]|jgi:YfiH family protein|nr:peptidoglycan editing factor PgeF [Bryobacteraceae bacterium]